MIAYVVGFLFYEEKVVLIRKKRPAWQAGKLNGVGGHIEPGETPIEAMVREFKEETGFLTTKEEWTHIAIVRGNNYELNIFRSFFDYRPEVKSMGSEYIEEHYISDLLAQEVVDGIEWMIPLCADKSIIPLIEIHRQLKGEG